VQKDPTYEFSSGDVHGESGLKVGLRRESSGFEPSKTKWS
jgi:hypothetical protein